MSHNLSNALEFSFICPLPNGLHARPASQLAEFASSFRSELLLTNLRTRATANLKSTLGILSTDVRAGDECSVRVFGADDEEAGVALRGYIAENLANSDEPLVEIAAGTNHSNLPRALMPNAASYHFGVTVSSGIGKGKAVVAGGISLPANLPEKADDALKEQRLIERAVAALRERIRTLLSRSMSPTEAGVLKAHLGVLDDVAFTEKVSDAIAQGRSAGQAILETGHFFSSLLQHSESPYIRDRAIDIQEICLRLLEEIYGSMFGNSAIELTEPSVLVAETLAAQQLLTLERKWLKGLVLEYAGTTSHAVILARSLGIPAIVGVKDAPVVLSAAKDVVVDANRGFVVSNGGASVQRFYDREQHTQHLRHLTLSRNGNRPAITLDGKRLEVAANVSSAADVAQAFAQGAEGIGLFRTEMLFMGRDRAPSEEEQFEIYREALLNARGLPLIVRTIDIGGDKPVPHLNLPHEPNPYLGYRGMRIYAEHRDLFCTQLRALLRASAFGPLQVMAPMVSTIEEVRWLKEQVAHLRNALRSDNVTFDPKMGIGIMIEVPSLAFVLDQLSKEVDFFSIGTNDLNQYFLAADRDNAKVAELSSVRHPSFLRFLKHIVDGVHRCGRWIGMCGEMAGDIHNLPILLGLGLDEISIAAAEIPRLKERISRTSSADCERLLERMMACTQVNEVEKLLEAHHPRESAKPLLDPGLVILASDSRNKEEAIRELIDTLYVAGRTDNPDRLEQVIWAREAAYTTGLGHGFAIPHCRSEEVAANSIAILKLTEPIEWGSLEDTPVSVVILLAVRESDPDNTHMQVLSKMARKLMHEDFRRRLTEIGDSGSMLAYLAQELDIS